MMSFCCFCSGTTALKVPFSVDMQVVRNGIILGGTQGARAKCALIAVAEFVVNVGYSNTVDVDALHMETGKVLAEIHADIGDAAAGVAFHASQDTLFFVGYDDNFKCSGVILQSILSPPIYTL
jgi:hypothetical protein